MWHGKVLIWAGNAVKERKKVAVKMGEEEGSSVENRPGIFVFGSSNVGKRTLLSRMVFFKGNNDHGCQLVLDFKVNPTTLVHGCSAQMSTTCCVECL